MKADKLEIQTDNINAYEMNIAYMNGKISGLEVILAVSVEEGDTFYEHKCTAKLTGLELEVERIKGLLQSAKDKNKMIALYNVLIDVEGVPIAFNFHKGIKELTEWLRAELGVE